MPSVRGFGFKESYEFALDIGRTGKQNKDLPSFRPSIEETLHVACLISLIWKISGYNGVDLAEGKIRFWWSRGVVGYTIDCVYGVPLLGLYIGGQVSRITRVCLGLGFYLFF